MTEKILCTTCGNVYNLDEVSIHYELKNVYNEVYSTIYKCKYCEEKMLYEIKLNKEEELRYKEESRKLTRDEKYSSIIGQRILDVLSNEQNELYIILESGEKIYHESNEDSTLMII